MELIVEQRRWLAWLSNVRIIVLTFLLGIQLAIVRLTPTTLPLRPFIAAILLWYTLSVFFLVLASAWHEEVVQAKLQVFTDLGMATLLIYVTGGAESTYNFLYPLVIVVACILLPRAWAYLVAAMAFIFYGTVLELCYFEVLPAYSSAHPTARVLLAIILINLFADLTIGYLAATLAQRLRQADARLRHASGELENLQALHENIIQSITGGIITAGLDGRVQVANAAACTLLDLEPSAVIGEPVQSLFLEPLPYALGGLAHGEVRARTRLGRELTLDLRASCLTAPGRGITGYIYAFDDLTEVRRLEREIRVREQQAAIGRLAGAIAHEIRNPLASIGGSVNVLYGIAALTDEQRLLIEIVTRESERLNAIITDFLAYSRGRHFEFAKVDILPLLEQVLDEVEARIAREGSAVRVLRSLRAHDAWTMGDGARLQQAFRNLCENALAAMPEGGTLTVSLQAVEYQEVGDDDNGWEICVSDTGNTLTHQQALRIFEPFQHQNHVGTGLALAIVYQIVQAHDGRITAGPCQGGGTGFRLLLRREEARIPLSKDEKAAEAAASARIVVDLASPATSRSASAGSGGTGSTEGGARG
jgi:two-component system sensor histidine kinase PilS (NtrC family)